jgi:hypothetical protein
MKDQAEPALSVGDSQSITIQLPNRIVIRTEKYAMESGNTITGVMIEALDTSLRSQNLY